MVSPEEPTGRLWLVIFPADQNGLMMVKLTPPHLSDAS
jgi:hypothetical protein